MQCFQNFGQWSYLAATVAGAFS